MMNIDLNADLGEGCASDGELLTLVSSANIACGFHAGDAQTMLTSVREALKNGVAIGAHPSFPDRENFGRRRTLHWLSELRCRLPVWGDYHRGGGRSDAGYRQVRPLRYPRARPRLR